MFSTPQLHSYCKKKRLLHQLKNMDKNELMDILFNQDMDMGVFRDFYDPMYNENQRKQREQEQAKLDNLKQRLAQHEARYFTTDTETGERIPSMAGLHTPPLQPQNSQAKDLDDIMGFLQSQISELESSAQFEEPYHHFAVNSDPWQTKAENLSLNSNQKPFPVQSENDDRKVTDALMDHFDFMQSQGSTYDQPFPLDNTDINCNRAQWDTLNSGISSYRAAAVSNNFSSGDLPSFQPANFSGVNCSSKVTIPLDDVNMRSPINFSIPLRKKNRDVKLVTELEIPFSVDAIVTSPVEEFNLMIRDNILSEEQLNHIKDIRRRGKNKVAAHNCRKKKQSELSELELELRDLRRRRNTLVRDKAQVAVTKTELNSQVEDLHDEIFRSFRDESGNPYNPKYYELQISENGEVGVAPKYLALT